MHIYKAFHCFKKHTDKKKEEACSAYTVGALLWKGIRCFSICAASSFQQYSTSVTDMRYVTMWNIVNSQPGLSYFYVTYVVKALYMLIFFLSPCVDPYARTWRRPQRRRAYSMSSMQQLSLQRELCKKNLLLKCLKIITIVEMYWSFTLDFYWWQTSWHCIFSF